MLERLRTTCSECFHYFPLLIKSCKYCFKFRLYDRTSLPYHLYVFIKKLSLKTFNNCLNAFIIHVCISLQVYVTMTWHKFLEMGYCSKAYFKIYYILSITYLETAIDLILLQICMKAF